MKYPSTPFSTRLSGSAKETQLRIRSIFQFQKKRPPLWLLALVMALALGCGGLVSCQQAQQPELPEPPADQETPLVQQTHLEFYDLIEDYNQGSNRDFVLSEAVVDGALCYQFFNEERDITIHVIPTDNGEHRATVTTHHGSMEFDMPIFLLGHGVANGFANFRLADLTRDGEPDLVYVCTLSGFSEWHDSAQVFDLAEQKQYPVTWDNEILSTLVALPDGSPACVGWYETLILEDDTLSLFTNLYEGDPSNWGDCVGYVKVPFVLDREKQAFVLSDQLSINFDEKSDDRVHPVLTSRTKEILDYLAEIFPNYQIHYPMLPAQQSEGDLVISEPEFMGEYLLYETFGEAWRVTLTHPTGYWEDYIVVVSRSGNDESFNGILGHELLQDLAEPVEQIIQRVAYRMMDLDVTLYRNGYPQPLGIGHWHEHIFSVESSTPSIRVLPEYEPIYQSGDYWDEYRREGLTALRYYQAAENRFYAHRIDVTRSDLYTRTGIRVGSTREEVRAAYPTLYEGGYWHEDAPDFPGQDYLWYCDNSEGWGAAILFFFENDVVTQIRLNNMFN